MPEGELLNVEGVVKEKWLELEKFRQPSSDAADRKLLNTVNIELKLISRSCCMDMHFCILYLIYVNHLVSQICNNMYLTLVLLVLFYQ